MADGVAVTEQHRNRARQGYFLQKEALSPEEFDQHQIEVIASMIAYNDHLLSVLHKLTFEDKVYAR